MEDSLHFAIALGVYTSYSHIYSCVQASGKNLVVINSKLKRLVWYKKLLYLAIAVIAITFIVTTMVVNDQSFKVCTLLTIYSKYFNF